MAEPIRFTDQMEMRLLAHFSESWLFEFFLPIFVWLNMSPEPLLDTAIRPIFYVNNNYAVKSLTQYHLLRGASEAVCEEAWETYQELVGNGICESLVRRLLPVSLMIQGAVTLTSAELMGFVAQHRESPTTELALIAQGYERAFHGDRDTGNRDRDCQVSGHSDPGG